MRSGGGNTAVRMLLSLVTELSRKLTTYVAPEEIVRSRQRITWD